MGDSMEKMIRAMRDKPEPSALPSPASFRKMLEGMSKDEVEDVRNALDYLTQIVNKAAPVTRGI